MNKETVILLVDDDNLNVKLGTAILKYRYRVDVAMSGREALEYLNTHPLPSLLLLDLHMPDMSGFEVLAELKKDVRFDQLPVIILTADDDKTSEVEGFKLGVMDFITKPMVAEVLRERINRVLTLNERQRELSTDRLTGLNIRTVGESEIEKAMSRDPGFLAFLDVDNLKRINDTIGHDAGDRVLKLIGTILSDCAGTALTCRLGGDEFLLFIKNITKEKMFETIEAMISGFLTKKEEDIAIRAASISIGLVETNPSISYKEAYSKADKALYHVKQNGKDGYFLYKETNDEEEQKDSGNLTRLKSALKKSGSYHGAMNVEFREFAKLYEYFSNLKRRFQHSFHLVMLGIRENEKLTREETEETMVRLEDAIRETIRSVDVCTRYSTSSFLLILVDPGTQEQIAQIQERIVTNFREECPDERISINTYDTEME